MPLLLKDHKTVSYSGCCGGGEEGDSSHRKIRSSSAERDLTIQKEGKSIGGGQNQVSEHSPMGK